MIEQKTYTLKEIKQQPLLWKKVAAIIGDKRKEIDAFIDGILSRDDSEIIFTGSGSSYFVGEMVAPFFQKDTGVSAKAVESAEIVTHPEFYINKNRQTLLVSFARSGNSPESVGAINAASRVTGNIKHLIITCNKDGALAKIKDKNSLIIIMPDEANDKSLAMTSSVTSMALAALLVGRLGDFDAMQGEIDKAASLFEGFFTDYTDRLQKAASVKYTRAVFLGSAAMKGVAHEAHLKLQELTDGEIICKYDSFLGFRHGPKAVVTDKTLMVYFFSNDDYVRQYEKDLVQSMHKSHSPALSVSISNKPLKNINTELDISLSGTVIDDGVWTVTAIVVAQLLAFFKSVQMGYNPDSPSKSGAIHRVVQGVTIYNKRR